MYVASFRGHKRTKTDYGVGSKWWIVLDTERGPEPHEVVVQSLESHKGEPYISVIFSEERGEPCSVTLSDLLTRAEALRKIELAHVDTYASAQRLLTIAARLMADDARRFASERKSTPGYYDQE